MTGWVELFRGLGESLVDVLKAELEAGRDEVARSGKLLGIALALFAGALVVAWWVLALLIFTLVALLAVWLPMWGAALVVTGLLAAVAGVLAWLGNRKLREFESPFELVKRRAADHLEWWRTRLLAEEKKVGPARPVAGPGPVVAAGSRSGEDV